MLKRLLTVLLVLVVVLGATATIGFAEKAETLTGNLDSKTITEDTELNLAGYSIGTLTVEPGVTVTLSGDGTIGEIVGTVDGAGTVVLTSETTETVDIEGTNYSVDVNYLDFADGTRLILGTPGVNLSMSNVDKNGASMYYTSAFGGNVTDKIAAYGVALYVGSAKNLFADNTYTRNEDFSGWTNEAFAGNGVLLKGILKTGNAYSVNKANATKKVYNVPYVELNSGVRVTASPANTTLQNVVETVTDGENPGSATWDRLSYTQKSNVVNLYNTFERFMSTWDMPRLEPYVEDGTYPLYTASDAQMMAGNPNASYTLMADIDMNGATINGIENFTGSITGNGNTISNVTVNGIGLVDTVAAGESVTNLKLEDVKVIVPADATATAVGTIAGTNNGTISGSYAIGSVKDTRADIKMGALVGDNKGTITTTAFTDEIVVNTLKTDGSGIGSNNTTYSTAGLAAAVGLYNDADNVTKALIGTNSGTVTGGLDTIYWRDSSYSTDRQAQDLQAKRQTVVDYAYQSGTIRWTVPSTITYYNDQKNQPSFNKGDRQWVQTGTWPWQGEWVGTYHIHNQQFNPGTVYNGIPYAHTSSSIEQAKFYMTEDANGVYTLKSEIATLSGGSDYTVGDATWYNASANGGLGWAKYLGSDCSGALTMAWHKVTPIRDLNRTEANKGVCLYYTTNIVPTEFNQWNYGFVKVGDYTVDDAALASTYELTGTDFTTNDKTQTKKNYPINTDMIVADIIANQDGVNTVYEAYAKAQMGDIMVSSGTAGHTRMLAQDAIVIRNGNGVIDPAKSYFVTHEQGDGLYERAETLSSWRINYKYTFEQLAYQNTTGLTGSSGYYLPVTMKAFHDTSVTSSGQITLSGGRAIGTTNDPSYVVINSAYRIQSATMTIMDAPNGNVLYQKTAFQGTSSSSNRYRATPGNITMWMNEFFSDYGANLTSGETYYFTLSGTTYTNATPKNVYTNEAFVYTPAA